MDKKYCQGCRDNFYNGNNPLKVETCWSLDTAELVERISIGFQEPPPYLNKKKVKVPTCWHGEGPYRTLYIDPDVLTETGYWK